MWELNRKEGWAPKNWYFWNVVLEKTLESPLDFKEIQSVHPKENQSLIFIGRTWKNWYWSWSSSTLATWWEELTHLKRPWCWERLKVGGEGDNRAWDGCMASPTWWRWVWESSGSWRWTGKPGVLQSTGSQRFGLDWVSEQQWDLMRIFRTSMILLKVGFVRFIYLLYVGCSKKLKFQS